MKIQSKPDIKRASRVVIEEGSKPNRVVLREIRTNSYVVHLETLKVAVNPEPKFEDEKYYLVHEAFHYGDYFADKSTSVDDSLKKFNERASKL